MNTEQEGICLAIDLGAESGRVVAGTLEGGALELKVVHRFPNGPVETGSGLRWNFTELYKQILHGLKLAGEQWGDRVVSIGVDTWGVDYGLVDTEGNLLAEPHHYRDNRTEGIQDEVFKLVPSRKIYDITGIQIMPFNTIYQLYAEARADTDAYRDAHRLLFIPDLINYRLTGRMTNEQTIASTSQLLDARTQQWAMPLLQKLNLRTDLFGELIEPGEEVGRITPELSKLTGLPRDVRVFAVGSHDTASAVAGVPALGDGWAFLSSGTWSLLGVEVNEPVINDSSYRHDFTNEAGVNRTIRLLKNIGGLWLLQECRRQWQRDGHDYTYAQLTEMADLAQPLTRAINPDDPTFATPGDMPNRINSYLHANGQQACESHAQMSRVILESLAKRYREVLNILEELTGQVLHTLHIVGGGTQNRLLNQLTANATERNVVTGPVESTAIGNVLTQRISFGALPDIHQARRIIGKQDGIEVYKPIAR